MVCKSALLCAVVVDAVVVVVVAAIVGCLGEARDAFLSCIAADSSIQHFQSFLLPSSEPPPASFTSSTSSNQPCSHPRIFGLAGILVVAMLCLHFSACCDHTCLIN